MSPGSLMAPPRRLVLPLGLAALSLLLWDTFVVYPFRLFVVFLHEASHGVAAVLTGGRVVSIGLSFDEGGVCLTRGGWPLLILNAGYLGSLLWGAVFLLLGARRARARSVIGLVGLFTLVVTLAYVRTLFGFLYGLGAALVLLGVASKLKPAVSEVLLAAIGATSCLYAVWDIATDVLLRHSGQSDASALARLTGLPAVAWGVVWIAFSILVLVSVLKRLA
ncbi:MAG TPA: M50 family metallopeptidase [Vicinamibacteria bacterium]|nr:M50 family metallopeptidase [Vicinamibacteria bacterium]